jgi:hypothetical protein
MMRCVDCLTEFQPNEDRFAVLKQMRDFVEGADEQESRLLRSMAFDMVFVCEGCSGWYALLPPIRVSALEATL